MIAYIKGTLAEVKEDHIIIENRQMGYEIYVPASAMNQLPAPGETIKIYTHLYVREDALKLYGFLSQDDLSVFKLLITVNGIGPKGALLVLSAISPNDLRFAILSEDVKTLSRAPGIGTKTARKLILDLKDKFTLEEAFEKKLSALEPAEAEGGKDAAQEAVSALVALGYSGADAMRAVKKAAEKEKPSSVETLLKAALKYISG